MECAAGVGRSLSGRAGRRGTCSVCRRHLGGSASTGLSDRRRWVEGVWSRSDGALFEEVNRAGTADSGEGNNATSSEMFPERRGERRTLFAIPWRLPLECAPGGPRMCSPGTWSVGTKQPYLFSAVPRTRSLFSHPAFPHPTEASRLFDSLSSPPAFSAPFGSAGNRRLLSSSRFSRATPAEGLKPVPADCRAGCRTPLGRCPETSQALEKCWSNPRFGRGS